ncbi:hypothetical protein [Hydrogenobacter thermophilus]|uniref:hypothetical protein n=1 Tax=Hydrogenobacter thermophilus TaxID=940 RepID=UPI0030F776B3
MRWISFVLLVFLGVSLLEPVFHQAYAKAQHKKVSIHKKKHKAKHKIKRKKVVVKPSRNINSPQEGQLLKLEGMVKDINEQ